MLKRSLLIVVIFIFLLLLGGMILNSGSRFSTVTNWLLPANWKIIAPAGGIRTGMRGADLARFSLAYRNCPLLTADGVAVHWADDNRLSIDKAELDYQCLDKFTDDEAGDTDGVSLSSILGFLPQGEAEIKALHWKNLPEALHPRLKQLLASPSAAKFAFFRQNLTAYLSQQAVEFEANFTNRTLSGNLRYQPSGQEKHNLLFSADLNDDPATIPRRFHADYHWILPSDIIADEVLREGSSMLFWETDEHENFVGDWSFVSESAPKNRLNFPFRFDRKTLEIQQGEFYWEWLESFPLQGFVTAKLTPKSFTTGEYYPIQTFLRFSLLSQSKTAGKGNIVLQNSAGEWYKDGLNLPLQVTGNVKYDDFVLYSSMPIDFSGKFDDLKLKFRPKSLLRLVGKERFLTIRDLRFPLAGIQIDKYGVNGRLQAVFKGESPDFKNIDLHLDGFAQNFKAGRADFFDDAPEAGAVQDRWNWKVWGSADVKSVATKLHLGGLGHWHKNLVRITDLNGNLGRIRQQGVTIPKTELSLLAPIDFAYEKWRLDGGLQVKSPEIRFDYGGKILVPQAKLHMNGEIENLNLRGELQAGKIGPLKLFARRKLSKDSGELIGRLYWHEQPADIFQPLLPLRKNWLITGGKIRGETAFSASLDKGLIAGGHFSIRHGTLSMPGGEAKGIDFNFPYRLQNSELDFGFKQPIDLSIAELDVGLPIRDIKAQVSGHYPHTRKQPLVLQELSMNLLDGSLKVERFALPQRQIAYLKLENIDFERILELVQYKQIELKGKANATLPFRLDGNPCYVCDGLLTQAVESNLKIQPELLHAISQSSGYSERLLLYLMHDTKITDLRSLINIGPQGDMVLDAKLKMQLNQQEKANVNFNYNHRENVFQLWHMINSGSYVEQQLENSIYQKLDNRK